MKQIKDAYNRLEAMAKKMDGQANRNARAVLAKLDQIIKNGKVEMASAELLKSTKNLVPTMYDYSRGVLVVTPTFLSSEPNRQLLNLYHEGLHALLKQAKTRMQDEINTWKYTMQFYRSFSFITQTAFTDMEALIKAEDESEAAFEKAIREKYKGAFGVTE